MAALTTVVAPDLDRRITTITAHGWLDFATAPALRAALQKAAAECPSAVIVDVSDCDSGSAAVLTVFPAAVRSEPTRPSVPVMLCGARPGFLHGASAVLGPVLLYPTWGEALHAAQAAEARLRRESYRFGRSPIAPANARSAIAEFCEALQLGHLRHPAMTIISELVTNAIIHADSDAAVDISVRGDFLHLRVRDQSPEPPVIRHGGVSDHGNGMVIVASMSTAWGFVVSPDRSGKVVWSTLRARPVGGASSSRAG
jgi:anti-sigma regulatory factor (Ser/Thr protein kinase)